MINKAKALKKKKKKRSSSLFCYRVPGVIPGTAAADMPACRGRLPGGSSSASLAELREDTCAGGGEDAGRESNMV